jgi:hypothetical protein
MAEPRLESGTERGNIRYGGGGVARWRKVGCKDAKIHGSTGVDNNMVATNQDRSNDTMLDEARKGKGIIMC